MNSVVHSSNCHQDPAQAVNFYMNYKHPGKTKHASSIQTNARTFADAVEWISETGRPEFRRPSRLQAQHTDTLTATRR